MTASSVPSLYEWLGGIGALNRLTERFYERVRDVPVLAPVFVRMGRDHPSTLPRSLQRFLAGHPNTRIRSADTRTFQGTALVGRCSLRGIAAPQHLCHYPPKGSQGSV